MVNDGGWWLIVVNGDEWQLQQWVVVNGGELTSKHISERVDKIVFSFDKIFIFQCYGNVRYQLLPMKIFWENIELKIS